MTGVHKEPPQKFSEEYKKVVEDHIESFRPQISHYRREHAPNRRYLPSHLTITDMHKMFVEQQTARNAQTCSLAYYFGLVKAKNISFAMPENDLCERCLKHKKDHPDEDHECETCECSSCDGYTLHRQHAAESRAALAEDTLNMERNPTTTAVYTVDMQKALLMPKLPSKDYYFSRKLVLFNETFAKPGKTDPAAITVLWHEGEAGRKAFNITNSFLAFLQLNRDFQEIVLYSDNCSAQNRNWTLISALPRMVNSPTLNANSITLKFLEPGHTFMSADSVHASIASKMKRQSTIYDLDDYIQMIESSRKQIKTIILNHSHMYKFENESRKTNLRLTNAKVLQFRRGSTSLFWKSTHNGTEDFKEVKFYKTMKCRELESKISAGADLIEGLPTMAAPRGIPAQKKADLLKLASLMPRYKAAFFESLVENTVDDLETEGDY